VTEWQIVVGKFLASCTLLVVMFGCTLMYPLTLDRLGDLDWGATMAGYVGMLLLGGAYCAIGIMASSFTKDQVVSILVAFFLCFALYLVDQLAGQPTGGVAFAFQYASTSYHFQNIARGVIDVRDVVYYLSLIVVCLYIARTVIASRRW
jgi:ABC-2 type transport system permease protein